VVTASSSEGAALASDRSVGVGTASPCCGGTTGEGAALASVSSVGLASASHCGTGHVS
jgi:hypothetical protein